VHPSTVSRAVSNKYGAHARRASLSCANFFLGGRTGAFGAAGLPLLILKRRVKKMIEEEDTGPSTHRRTDLPNALQSERDPSYSPHRREVPRGYAHSFDATSGARPQIRPRRIQERARLALHKNGDLIPMKVSYKGVRGELPPLLQEKLDTKFREARQNFGWRRREDRPTWW